MAEIVIDPDALLALGRNFDSVAHNVRSAPIAAPFSALADMSGSLAARSAGELRRISESQLNSLAESAEFMATALRTIVDVFNATDEASAVPATR